MAREIAKLKTKVFTEQFNIPIDMELKQRLTRLKFDRHVDTHEEARKVIRQLVNELEAATA